ncbi:MAG: hypothetical protein HUU38_05525 [Anaerolineales bacterium]|nr:hypothetical protein [Anaerolineales bacterium]
MDLIIVFPLEQNSIVLPLAEELSLMANSFRHIKEDDVLYFKLRSKDALPDPIIWIQDIEFNFSEPAYVNGYFEYYFPETKDSRPFLNHFGQSDLVIEIQNGTSIFLYTSLEVIAKNNNAIRAEYMLDYLEGRMEDVVRACFSITHQKGDPIQAQATHAFTLLQEIKQGLNVFFTYRSRFIEKRRSRIIPQSDLKELSSAHISENSIYWLINNLDQLDGNYLHDSSTVMVNGRRFRVQQIESDSLIENTNVYENQVIMGYLEDLLATLINIEHDYSKLERQLPKNDPIRQIPSGYQSLTELREKFGKKYFSKLLTECHELQKQCRESIKFCNQYLPVKQVVREMPKMTDGFNAYSHYREVFRQIVSWYRLGKLNVSGERFLYSLRTLDKLYEFFCLFNLIDALSASDFHMIRSMREEKDATLWETNPDSIYDFVDKDDVHIRLHYEPHINTTADSEHTPIYVYANSRAKWGFLAPDFLMEIHYRGNLEYAIFDSKYTNQKNATHKYLPELTMKYIHSIGQKEGGYSPIKAMIILFSGDVLNLSGTSINYHRKEFDIFSVSPIFPILGAICISPATDKITDIKKPTPNLAKFLRRLIKVLTDFSSHKVEVY